MRKLAMILLLAACSGADTPVVQPTRYTYLRCDGSIVSWCGDTSCVPSIDCADYGIPSCYRCAAATVGGVHYAESAGCAPAPDPCH